jgi:uncharacterized protein
MNILKELFLAVLGYLKADWLILLIGILIAVSVNVYMDSNKLKKFLEKKAGISIPGAVGIGALTPLCACGTMAVLLSMFITAMPWGPVMAFLISSPLSSPSDYIFETAFFGSRFATGLLIASILLGLIAGFVAHLLEKKTNFFKDQFRLNNSSEVSNCCNESYSEVASSCCSSNRTEAKGCCSNNDSTLAVKKLRGKEKIEIKNSNSLKIIKSKVKENKFEDNVTSKGRISDFVERYKLKKFAYELYNIGVKKILLYFIVFIAIGRIVELFIPKEWIISLFSGNKSYSIPLAATIGLPLYLSDASAIPLLKSFINAGAGEGAVLAFLIAGKATGIPVIAGMSTFMKKRALLFYITFVYVGAIVSGYLYQIISLIKL